MNLSSNKHIEVNDESKTHRLLPEGEQHTPSYIEDLDSKEDEVALLKKGIKPVVQDHEANRPHNHHDTTKKPDESGAVSIEEAIEVVGIGCFQYRLILIGGVILLASYVATGGITFILQPAQCDLGMNSNMKGNLASANVFGLILSCHLMGFLSDTLGRRFMMLRCLCLDALVYIIISLAPNNYLTILTLRVFNGVASCGAIVSVFAYIGEFQTTKFRTTAILCASLVVTASYTFVPAVAWLIIPQRIYLKIYPGLVYKSWRVYHVLTSIPSLVAVILLYFQPESPKFLLAKGKNEEAIQVLRKMYKINKGEDNFKITKLKISDCEKVAKLGDDSNKAVAFLKLMWNQTVPLFRMPHQRNLALLSSALSLIYYSNSALYVWMPEVLNGIAIVLRESNIRTGTLCDVMRYKNNLTSTSHNLKIYNFTTVKEVLPSNTSRIVQPSCKEDVDVSVYSTYVVLSVILIFSWIGILILKRYIRKKLLLLGFTALTASAQILMMFPYYLKIIPSLAIISLIGSGSVFPILNSVVVDIFPTNLRAMASCLALMFYRIGTICGYSITGLLIDNYCYVLIMSFITATLGCFLTIIFLPMTVNFAKEDGGKKEACV